MWYSKLITAPTLGGHVPWNRTTRKDCKRNAKRYESDVADREWVIAGVVQLRAATSAVHERFEQVDKRLDDMNQNVNQRFNELNQSVAQVRSWLVGLYVFIALSFLGVIAKDLIFK